ncbi:MAG TPA: sialidase family protein [Acidimicrobiales bacterium]|nr:sialidase family protein [Acidimicrobiales bacterium]
MRRTCLLSAILFIALASVSDTTVANAVARATVHFEVPMTAIDLGAERAQNSPMLAVDPQDDRFVAAAGRVDGPSFDCQLHLSGSRGRGWVPVRPVQRLPRRVERCYAPEVAFDGDGVLYYLFAGLRGRGNEPVGAFLTSSKDRGRSFSVPRRVMGPGRYMVRMVIDPRHGDRGRLHLVWVEPGAPPALGGFSSSPNRILASHSDDGGTTFSAPVEVSERHRSRVVAPAVAVGATGRVHVAYYDLGDDAVDFQGLEGPPWEGTWSVVTSTSTDGGASYRRHTVVDAQMVPTGRVMLIFTMAGPALATGTGGRAYVAWPDARSGDWDVLLRRSFDEGSSWSGLRRVNDDPVGNGRHQYLPRLSVSPNGRLDVVYYDRRADPSNVLNQVSYTFSGDKGRSFAPAVTLTSEPSDTRTGPRYPVASAVGLVDPGSRLGLVSSSTGALAAWTDTRTPHPGSLHQDVFTATVRVRGAQQERR